MKKVLALVGMLALAGTSLGQGQINFLNYNPPAGVNGRVYLPDASLAGSTVWGQLYVGAPGGSLAPVGSPVAFSDALPGAVIGGTVTVAGIIAGGQADVQLRSWLAADGADYDTAFAAGGTVGESPVLANHTLGGGLSTPSFLVGLGETQMYVVPEPSTWALMALGLGALALRRRK